MLLSLYAAIVSPAIGASSSAVIAAVSFVAKRPLDFWTASSLNLTARAEISNSADSDACRKEIPSSWARA